MNTKKKEKKAAKRGRPKKNIIWAHLGLRVNMEEAALIAQATQHEAARLHLAVSKNNFCLRACVEAAKKELALAESNFSHIT
jgi:uncharacterized protein (DUF1778 family)